jgi:hypothetical protein
MVLVDQCYRQQRLFQCSINRKREAESEFKPEHCIDNNGNELDRRVSKGNGFLASSASPSENQIAQDGNVIPRMNRCSARSAVGSRSDDGFSLGKSIDDYIAEATND